MVRRFRTIKDSKPCNRTVLSVSACVAAPPRRDLLPAATESPSVGAMPSLLLSEPHPTEEMKSKNFKKRKVDEDEEESDTTSDSTVAKRPKLMEEGVEADDPNALSNFRISNALREALELKGIKALFPIQAMTFDLILDGFDLVGRARTGQGKTLAFVLPILESLTNGILKGSRKTGYGRSPSVLVLLPTRELAKQVHSDFEVYGEAVGLSSCCLYGGSPFRAQVMSIKEGVDIVVGTPGRVKDHIQRNTLDLKTLNFRVLDEADEMLKMGFVNDVEQILRKVEDARKVQTLLFSATLPDWVKKISARFLKKDKKTADLIGNQKLKASANVRHLVLPCSPSVRQKLIPYIIDFYSSGGRTIIFTETKRSADKLGGILPGAQALHGDIMQQQREVILAGFRSGKFLVLVATNVAARGLDISDVQLIIQCEPPRDVEDYIHRSGRTGRAGNTGIAILLYEPKNKSRVSRIEKDSGVKFEHISAPESAGIDESAESLAATAITNVNRFSRGRDGKRFSNGGSRGGSWEDGRGERGRGRGRGGNRGGSREGGRGGGGRGRGRAGSGGNRFNRRR